MGTELQLIIGQRMSSDDSEAMAEFVAKYGQGIIELARFDLSGVSAGIWAYVDAAREMAQIERDKTGKHYIVYTRVVGDDNNEVNLHEDAYGLTIAAAPLADFLELLKVEGHKSRAEFGGNMYRRYEIAINLLSDIQKHFEFEGDIGLPLTVLFYGH